MTKENNKEIKKDEEKTENKITPALEKGNYIITIVEDGKPIKRFIMIESEMYIEKMKEGGLTIDLN